jgi:hypothetical protein
VRDFEDFVAARGDSLVRFALMLCGDPHRAEDLLRETFQSREGQAPRLSRVRPKPRRTPWIAAGIGTLVVLAGAIVGANAVRGPAPVTLNAPSASPTIADESPAPGWRWESSLGMEVQVPDTWTVNDFGCGMSDKPTIERGNVNRRACAGYEPPTKEVAFIGSAVSPESPNARSIVVDGVAALRFEWRRTDGRFSGTVSIPSRDVSVEVRTMTKDLTQRILDSARLVDVDHLGCAARTSWPTEMPTVLAGKPSLPDHPSRLVLCLYGGQVRLQSSVEVSGAVAEEIFAGIRSAKEGPNPDPTPGQCRQEPAKAPDLVVLPDGGVPLSVVFYPCTGRGITDGRHWAHVTKELVADLMIHTRTGWGYVEPLE